MKHYETNYSIFQNLFHKQCRRAEQNCSATPSKNLRRETEKQKKILFSFGFMVRDAGFEPARRSEGT